MALIRDVRQEWSDPVVLEKDEIWQARNGSIYFTTTPEPESDDGLAMILRDGIRLCAGVSVRYRKDGEGAALIAREAVQ
jgi:hypothetical protein